MPRAISLGEALIDIFAGEGVGLRELRPLHPTPGGAPANVAVALARLGVDVGFIGRVGDDEYGRLLIDRLSGEGVNTTHFRVDRRAPTMLAIVDAPSASEQHFVIYHGADILLRPEDLDLDYVQSARVLIYGSVTLTAASGPAAEHAAELVGKSGGVVIFDVNVRPNLWLDEETCRAVIWQAIGSATVVKVNRAELEFLTGTADLAAGCRKIFRRGAQLVCVSIGAEGSYYDNGDAHGHVPGFAVQAEDTTGSGDAFVAGLASGILQHKEKPSELDDTALHAIIRFANACGALAATRMGAMRALPTRAEVDHLAGAG